MGLISKLASSYLNTTSVSNKSSFLFVHCMIEELVEATKVESNPQNLTTLLYLFVSFTGFNHMIFTQEENEMILDLIVSFLSHPNKTIRKAAQTTLSMGLYKLEEVEQKQILDRFIKIIGSDEEKGVSGF